jgi:hypothetical protein
MINDAVMSELLHYETADDGSLIQMYLSDSSGQGNIIRFSMECINTLVMTLPSMALTAIQARLNDDSIRVTYPLEAFEVMFGTTRNARILNLKTPDGFTISFSLTEDQCHAISEAAILPFSGIKLP